MRTKFQAGTPEEKRQLGKYRCRWEDNIKTNLKETGSEGVDWILPAKYRGQWRAPVNTIINFRVP
jgi:hypothetical protein